MRNINSIKHAELIHLIREMGILFKEKAMLSEEDALQNHGDNLNNLHQEYLQTIVHLEKIIEEYNAESRIIRHLLLSKPFRKLKLKNKQPDKFRLLVSQVNSFAS